MSWDTAVSTWRRLTLVVVHEQSIQYGGVLGWCTHWIARDAASSFATGEDDPSRNRRSLAARDALGLAAKACSLVSRTSSRQAQRGDAVLLHSDDAATRSPFRKAMEIQLATEKNDIPCVLVLMY